MGTSRATFSIPAAAADLRDLVTILLTIRNYPPSTSFPNPQTITLQGAAPVRNYLR